MPSDRPSLFSDPALRGKLALVGALYFASGFPFGFLNDLVPVYFSALGVSVEKIGLLSLIALPYTLKVVWSPLLDWVGTRRQWIGGSQVGLGLLLAAIAMEAPRTLSTLAWVLLVGLAVLSATQDMAIDAFTIEYLDKREYGLANGLRVTAYRAAMIVAGGLLLAVGGKIGWRPTFSFAAAVMLALAAVTLATRGAADARRERAQREGEAPRGLAAALAPLWGPLRELGRIRYWPIALLFVLTFKIGDLALQPMVWPFWVSRGYTPAQIGFVLVTLGIGATIVGALLGGALASRVGTFHALWISGLVHALAGLGYYLAATSSASAPVMYGTAVLERFTSGLGTAAFLTFLMDLCEKRFAATQYALLSALYRLGGIAAGSISGYATRALGYADYFLLTFALAFPAFLLLPWIRRAELGLRGEGGN